MITGRFVFRERLTRLQLAAAICALIGIIHEVFRVGSVSWPVLMITLGYPAYFVLRRKFALDNIGGLWFDLVLLLPVAVGFAITGQLNAELIQQETHLIGLLLMLGLISASALIAYILSSRMLNLGLFGLLGYVEPLLLLAVALILGERLESRELLTYGPIWFAVMILVAEGLLFIYRRSRHERDERIS